MYEKSDIGKSKAAVLAQRLGARARGAVRAQESLDYDLIFECSDNVDLKFAINDGAVGSGTPTVIAGVAGLHAFVLAVRPRQGPCLRCVFQTPNDEMRRSCRDVGVLAPLPTLVAAVMVEWARRLWNNQTTSLWSLNFSAGSARSVTWQRDSLCAVCS